MNNIIFDIETAPLPVAEISHLMPEFEAGANLKDPEKIRAAIEAKREAWLEKLALDPMTGSVCAIGYNFGDNETEISLAYETSELSIIESFWEYFSKQSERAQFVGFNIFKFDLPFLVRRSWKLGIPIPLGVRTGRYWGGALIDLMDVYAFGNKQEFVSLDSVSKFLGVGEKSGNGKDFHLLPQAEQRKYLAHDLALTKACAEKLLA